VEDNQEEVMKVFRDFREVSPRMGPLDKRQFQQILERTGEYLHVPDELSSDSGGRSVEEG
jgi:hypothetical protein